MVLESAAAMELAQAGKKNNEDEQPLLAKATANTIVEQTVSIDSTELLPVLVKQPSVDLRKESEITDDSLLSGIKLRADHGKVDEICALSCLIYIS
jgi:hypothetical protein